MKRNLLFVLAVVLALGGCMTANQLAAEKSYYDAMASMTKAREAQPIFVMEAAVAGKPIILENVASIKVYSAGPAIETVLRQYQHRDFTPTWIPAILNAAAPLAALYGGSLLLKQAGGSSYTQTVSGTGNVAAASNPYGTFGVSPPTVVNQPAPVVVDPKVVVVPPSYPPK